MKTLSKYERSQNYLFIYLFKKIKRSLKSTLLHKTMKHHVKLTHLCVTTQNSIWSNEHPLSNEEGELVAGDVFRV